MAKRISGDGFSVYYDEETSIPDDTLVSVYRDGVFIGSIIFRFNGWLNELTASTTRGVPSGVIELYETGGTSCPEVAQDSTRYTFGD
jgi:hypothetical protein